MKRLPALFISFVGRHLVLFILLVLLIDFLGCIQHGYHKTTLKTPVGDVVLEIMANVGGPPKESTDVPVKVSFDPEGFNMLTGWLDSKELVDLNLGETPKEKSPDQEGGD